MTCGAFFIKDLKDLENGTTRVSIDIKDLKDLKRHLLTLEIAGDRLPRYDKKRHCLTVGRGPVPRHRACTRNPTIAGETHSDARMETSEGHRATGTSRPGGLSYREDIEI